MTVEFWRHAELFYELGVVILGLLLLLCVIALVFIVSYTNQRKRKGTVMLTIGIMTILSTVGLYGHWKYRPYLEQASYTNALIRDREPRLHVYIPYGSIEQAAYARLNHLEGLRKLTLYEEERVYEPIVYLGQGEYTHYFERMDGELFSQNRHIEFTDTTGQTQLIGSQFMLRDDDFQEIGFKNPKNVMFDRIKIPLSEKGKSYTPTREQNIQRADKVVHNWNFPN